jgi:hypothetical protein
MSNPVVAARLEIVAAKAKILAEKYKNNQLWDGELDQGIREITSELTMLGRETSSERGWSPGDR